MATRRTRRRNQSRNPGAGSSGLTTKPIVAVKRRQSSRAAIRPRRARSASVSYAPQPLRFGGRVAIGAALVVKGETGAAASGLAAFGLRASRLPCRWDLGISSPISGVRRRNSLNVALPCAERQSQAQRSDADAEFHAFLKIVAAARYPWRNREIMHVDLRPIYI